MTVGKQVGKGFLIPQAKSLNPVTNLQLTGSTTGGTLLSAIYYVNYTYVYADGSESAPRTTDQSFTATGSTYKMTINLGSGYFPTGVVGINIYFGQVSGQTTYYGYLVKGGTNFVIDTIINGGKLIPVYNTSSYVDVNLFELGLSTSDEAILLNVYYDSMIAFGMTDGAKLTVFDGDLGAGARERMARRVNNSQWLRICNPSPYASLNVFIDGVQSA